MAVQVKLYIEPEGEIRRFNLEANTNYAALEQRVRHLVGRDNFRLFWQDSEGDFVVCGSDDELKDARESRANGAPLRVYLRPTNKPSNADEPKAVHRQVTCDGCQGEVAGTRYKCMECPDYDLCEKCMSEGKHPEHDMLAVRTPRTHEWKKLFAHGYGTREGHRGHRHHGCGPRSARGPCGMPGMVPPPTMPGAPPTMPPPYMPPFNGVPPFVPPFFRHMMNRGQGPVDQTVEMDINIDRPLHEVISDVARKVTEAMNVAQQAAQEATAAAAPAAENKEEEKKEDEPVNVTATPVAEPVTMVAETVVQDAEPQVSQEVEGGWTHLQAEPVETEEKKEFQQATPDNQAPTPTQPQGEGRIEAALHAMEDMGFRNEGNLLRRLLTNYNGDISRVLDSIK